MIPIITCGNFQNYDQDKTINILFFLIIFLCFGFGVIYIYTHKARNREDLSVYDHHTEPLFSDAPALPKFQLKREL